MKVNHKGNYIDLLELDNGDLQITLTPYGREFLNEQVESRESYCTLMSHNNPDWPERCAPCRLVESVAFSKSHDWLWAELFDDIRANSDIEMLSDNDIAQRGHLTSAPIIGTGIRRDEHGDLEDLEKEFYFNNYMIESELETLLQKGSAIFQGNN